MATTRTSDGVKLLRCTAGTTAFCLDIERVRGVESAERLQRAPRDAAPGLLRSRGTDWPVFAPSRWFGAAARSQGAQIVLLESPHGRFGVLVDRVAPLGRVAADRIVAAPPFGTASGWVSGVFQSDDGPLALMDIHRMNAPEADEFEERPSSAPRVKPAGHAKRAGLSRWLALAGRQRDEVGGRRMAVVVPVSIVVEVIDAPPASPMPGAPAHIQGWIDWRKRPLVVTDPSQWVGLGAVPASPRVVVVRVEGERVGLAAGATVNVLPANAPCIPSRQAFAFLPGTTVGVFDTTDITVVSPDWSRFMHSLRGRW